MDEEDLIQRTASLNNQDAWRKITEAVMDIRPKRLHAETRERVWRTRRQEINRRKMLAETADPSPNCALQPKLIPMESDMLDPAMTDYAAIPRFAEGDEPPVAGSQSSLVERVARAVAEKAAANGSHAYVGNSDDLTSVMLGGQFNLMELASAAIAAMELPNPAPLHQDIPLHPNDGLQQDMTMNLLQNVAVYPSFQFWDTCAIRVGELSYSLQTISALDMFYVHSHQKSGSVCGLPTYISRSATTGDVAVYPTPDRDYELVRV